MTGKTAGIAERLERIAADLNKLSAALSASVSPPVSGADGEDALANARRLLAERRALQRLLPEAAAAEPAWAMLLVLFVQSSRGPPLSAKALAIAAGAPASTAQRWLDQLAAAGLVTRGTDPADRRRVELSLTEDGHELVARCLAALAPAPR